MHNPPAANATCLPSLVWRRGYPTLVAKRLEERGVPFKASDRGFMDSIYFSDPNGPPSAVVRGDLAQRRDRVVELLIREVGRGPEAQHVGSEVRPHTA